MASLVSSTGGGVEFIGEYTTVYTVQGQDEPVPNMSKDILRAIINNNGYKFIIAYKTQTDPYGYVDSSPIANLNNCENILKILNGTVLITRNPNVLIVRSSDDDWLGTWKVKENDNTIYSGSRNTAPNTSITVKLYGIK